MIFILFCLFVVIFSVLFRRFRISGFCFCRLCDLLFVGDDFVVGICL